jgi:cold shock protein
VLAACQCNGHRLARLPANQAEESTIATGTVKFFSTYRGYGFIQPSDSSPDVYVHISVVQCAGRSHLVGGQKVSFDVVIKAGKSAAENLKVKLSHLLRIRALFRRIRDVGRHSRPRAARRGRRHRDGRAARLSRRNLRADSNGFLVPRVRPLISENLGSASSAHRESWRLWAGSY